MLVETNLIIMFRGGQAGASAGFGAVLRKQFSGETIRTRSKMGEWGSSERVANFVIA
jgi:hypothetical protein